MQELDTAKVGLTVDAPRQMNNGYLMDKFFEIPEQVLRTKLDDSNGKLSYYSFYANYQALPWNPPEGVKFSDWSFESIVQYVADKIRTDFFQLLCQYNHQFEVAPITFFYERNANNELLFLSRIDTYHEKENPLTDRKIIHEAPAFEQSSPLTVDPAGAIVANNAPPVLEKKQRKSKKKA